MISLVQDVCISRSKMILQNRLGIFSCLLLFYGASISGAVDENELKIEMVQVLFRHGARTPLTCEAKLLSNGNDSLYDPWGIAELTNTGMMQEYNIGKMLRKRYKDFLPDSYKPKDVYAYASGTSRTKASLQLVLAALYPPTKQLKWNNELNWLPIPVNSNPRALDILIKPRNCESFSKALHKVMRTGEVLSEMEKHRGIVQKMREIYGKSFDYHDIFCAYSALKVHKEMNLPMPDWYTDEIFSALNEAKEFYLKLMSYTNILKKFNGGPFARRFLENMNDTHWRENKRKIYLYSAHDKTLYAVLKAHNLSGLKQPDYGSTIILEKYRGEQNKIYVKMLYWVHQSQEVTTIKLKNCTEICPFEKYIEIIKPYLPSDDDMLCLYKNITPQDMERIVDPDSAIAEGKENYVM